MGTYYLYTDSSYWLLKNALAHERTERRAEEQAALTTPIEELIMEQKWIPFQELRVLQAAVHSQLDGENPMMDPSRPAWVLIPSS